MNQTGGKFDVWQFFLNDDQEQVLSRVNADEAVKKAKFLFESVGAQIGTTKRIIITDTDDYTVFEWVHGKGIVFPPNASLSSEK